MNKTEKMNISSKKFLVRKTSIDSASPYGIYMDGALITTPSGIPVTANDSRGLLVMSAELDFSEVLDVTEICMYGMYSTEKEMVVPDTNCLGDDLFCSIASDAMLTACAGRESVHQWKYYTQVIEFFEENGLKHPCHTQFPDENGNRGSWSESEWSENYRGIATLIENELNEFKPAQASAFLTAMTFLQSPTLSLMLVLGKATPKETAYLYLMANCIYSKLFPDIKREDEIVILEKLTKYTECVRTYVELF